MFWGYQYEGSPEWLDKENIYGREEWSKMEKESIRELFFYFLINKQNNYFYLLNRFREKLLT